MHSIFITNGLGICSARRFADLWQAGLLHFITARKSRERERDSLSDPARNPSMHWGSKEQGPCHRRAISFDSSDSHCALGGFTASVFDIGFPSRRGVRCLFGDYLPCVLKWLFFCFVSSTDGQALTAFLAFDCYVPSSERQLGFWRLSKESWRVYVWRFFFFNFLNTKSLHWCSSAMHLPLAILFAKADTHSLLQILALYFRSQRTSIEWEKPNVYAPFCFPNDWRRETNAKIHVGCRWTIAALRYSLLHQVRPATTADAVMKFFSAEKAEKLFHKHVFIISAYSSL